MRQEQRDTYRMQQDPMAALEVLAVSGDRATRHLFTAAGKATRIGVRVVSTGGEILDLTRRLRPAAVLLDLDVPDMRGLTLLDVLAHDAATHDAAVLAVGEVALAQEALRRGAAGFLSKPADVPAIATWIAETLRPRESVRPRILVVDDDEACRELCLAVLAAGGYRVDAVPSVADGLDLMSVSRPDLVLMDVMLPGTDGISALDRLKADAATRSIPVIIVTGLGGVTERVLALKAGCDDYVTKPFDPEELVTRVEMTLRRVKERESISPNTLLPGSFLIEREIERRRTGDEPFAFCYVDVDNFKAFNDTYGYARADAVIRHLGDILRQAVRRMGDGGELLGHIAGDDFVLIGSLESCPRVLSQALREFDAIVPLYYDPADRANGSIVAEDRFGERRRFPIMTLSVACLRCQPGSECSYLGIADAAVELKKRAKKIHSSVVLKNW
ncbi:MAG: response regulator [Acidobacteriota bacterium]